MDEWFPDGKPDGTKFCSNSWFDIDKFFTPYFRTDYGHWYGLDNFGNLFNPDRNFKYRIYKPEPKPKTKKAIMYKPVYKDHKKYDYTIIYDEWHTDKKDGSDKRIVGWVEIKAEVEDTDGEGER